MYDLQLDPSERVDVSRVLDAAVHVPALDRNLEGRARGLEPEQSDELDAETRPRLRGLGYYD